MTNKPFQPRGVDSHSLRRAAAYLQHETRMDELVEMDLWGTDEFHEEFHVASAGTQAILEELASADGDALVLDDDTHLSSFITALASVASHFLRGMSEAERERWLNDAMLTGAQGEV